MAFSVSPAEAVRMKRGFGTQLWIQRPSAHSKWPFGARAPRIQLSNIGASGFSARCHTPLPQTSAPCSSEVSTHCPRPVISRARSAALIAVLAAKNAPRLGQCEAGNTGPGRGGPCTHS